VVPFFRNAQSSDSLVNVLVTPLVGLGLGRVAAVGKSTRGVEMARFHLIAEAGVASLPGLAYLILGMMVFL